MGPAHSVLSVSTRVNSLIYKIEHKPGNVASENVWSDFKKLNDEIKITTVTAYESFILNLGLAVNSYILIKRPKGTIFLHSLKVKLEVVKISKIPDKISRARKIIKTSSL